MCPNCHSICVETAYHENGCGVINQVQSDKVHQHFYCRNVMCKHEWIKEHDQ